MTQYLGIITAYGAIAVLAWLAVLLYPRLIPAAGEYHVDNRWREAVLFAAAVAISFALSFLRSGDLLLPGGNPLVIAANQLLVLVPVLIFIVTRKNRAALLIPQKHVLRSLAVGLGLAILALLAYFSSTNSWDELPLYLETLATGEALRIVLVNTLRCLTVAAFLALVANGWSIRVALGLAALAIAATQIPSLLESGIDAEWLGVLITHVLLVLGLLSAIHATRNIVWFWPVLILLNLLQFAAG